MRINFSDEENFENQALLWEANVRRSLAGRAGQSALRRLEAALRAMPDKRLAADTLESTDGTACALGALAKHEDYQGSLVLPQPPDKDGGDEAWDEWDIEGEDRIEDAMLMVAKDLRVPKLVALEIIYRNDDHHDSPEARYRSVLSWVQRNLRESGK